MSINLISVSASELREIVAAIPPFTQGEKEFLIVSSDDCVKLLVLIPGIKPPDNNQLVKYIKRSDASASVFRGKQ